MTRGLALCLKDRTGSRLSFIRARKEFVSRQEAGGRAIDSRLAVGMPGASEVLSRVTDVLSSDWPGWHLPGGGGFQGRNSVRNRILRRLPRKV